MSKVISYALFNNPEKERWLFYTYFRGLVWNVKMNSVLFPDWQTHIEVESKVFSDYDNIFFGLKDLYGANVVINETMPLCKGMLTRLKPIFNEDVDYVMCRDADAITTYREALIIQEELKNPSTVFTIRDNPAHNLEIMGGMSSFRAGDVRSIYRDWDTMLGVYPISLDQHGSDQTFLMNTFFKTFGASVYDATSNSKYSDEPLNGVSSSLWTSNLIPAFIGSAGVNNMEYLRFEKDHLKNEAFEQIEKSYPQIFYHHTL